MKGIITCVNCMTCMFAVSLTLGGPIRRQATQSEETVSIGGNFTLLCPFSPDDTWIWVYWKKNNVTIYSLDVQSITPWTNSTRYEVSKHATRLMIKDLKKTDSGMYHCKVATLATTNFNKEGGQVLLNVTDQEGGLFTTSPGFPVRASTSMPPKSQKPPNTFYLAFSITLSILTIIIIIIIIIITMCLVFKYRRQIAESRLVKACQRRARTRNTSTSVATASNPENVKFLGGSDQVNIPSRVPDSTTPDQISPSTPPMPDGSAQQGSQANVCDQADMPSRGQDNRPTTSRRLYESAPNDTHFRSTSRPYSSANLQQGSPATSRLDQSDPCGPIFHSTPLPCSSAQKGTHGSDDVDVDDRPEENSDASQALTSDAEETPLPPVGQLLIEDLCAENEKGRRLVVRRMRIVLHSFLDLHKEEDAPQKGYNYSASIKKYLSSGNLGVQEDVLRDVEYFLDALDAIPVDRKRDVCEILLTMPVNQQSDRSMFDLYKENFLKYDEDDQVRAANEKIASTLERHMRFILRESKTRKDALNNISAIILEALVKMSGSASLSQSLSQHTNSRSNQSAIEIGQTCSGSLQETSPLPQSVKVTKREDDNLIRFWLSKVTRLRMKIQRRVVLEQLEAFDPDAGSFPKSQQGSQAKICVQADNSLRASDTSTSSWLDASAPCDPNSCSTPLPHSSPLEKTMDQPDMINDNAKELKNKFDESTDQDKAMGLRNMPNTDAKEERNINLNDKTILEPQTSKSLVPPALDLNRLTREQLATLLHNAPKSNGQGSAKPGLLKDEIKGPMIKQIYAKDEEKAIADPDMQNRDVKELKNTNLKKSTELNKKSIEIPGEKEKG